MDKDLQYKEIGTIACRSLYNTGWPWPLGAVQGWFETILNSIRSIVSGIANTVITTLRSIWDAILQAIRSGVNWLISAVDWIKTNLTNIANWVWDKLRSAWDSIIKGISSAVDWIKSGLSSLRSWAESAISGLYSILQKAWDVLSRIGATIMDSVGGVLAGLLNALKDAVYTTASFIWTKLQDLGNLIAKAFEWVIDKIKSIFSSTWEIVASLTPKSVDEVPTKMTALIGSAGIAGVGTMIALDATGLEVLGTKIDLSGTKQLLMSLAPAGLISGATVGVVLATGVKPYVERWAKMQYRTWIPDINQAFILWRQKYFSETEYRKILAQHGVPEAWMPHATELADYTPPIMELLRVAQYSDLDPEWLYAKLIENGVVDKDIPKYQELFLNISLRRVHSEIYAELEKTLAYGVPSQDDFVKELDRAKFRSFIKPFYLILYQIVLNRYRVKSWVDAWKEQLYRGLITPEVFVENCLSIGIDKQIAVAWAVEQMAKRKILWELPTG